MSKTKRRLKAQKRRMQSESNGLKTVSRLCPNCGGSGPHFVPPCFGDSGFFICSKPTDLGIEESA